MSARPDTLPGYLSRTIRVRGVLVDVDVDGSGNPKMSLEISIVKPTGLAGQVYLSSATYPTMSGSADDIATRLEKGVYTFFAIPTPHKITNSSMWRKSDTTPGPLQPGYIYSFKWCYTIDGQKYVETDTELFDEEGRNLTPAQHYYTFLGLKNIASQFLGGQPGSETLSNIVNNAMIEVWSAHPWSFITADTQDFDVIGGQEYINLPADFLRLNAIQARNDLNHVMVAVSIQEMRAIRERAIVLPTLTTYYLVRHNPASDLTAIPRARLEIAPTPTASKAGVYTLDFDRYPPALSADTDIPPFPIGMAPLLKQAVRMVAAEDEGVEEAGLERGRFESILSRMTKMDERRDGQSQLGYFVSPRIHYNDNPIAWINPDVDLSTSGVGEG